jgi:adenylate kinase family enzyme
VESIRARDTYKCVRPMQKILVIGSGGAGKSTLAVRLAECTGLPLIHLDALYWRAGWKEPSENEWAAKVEELIRGERWIMDGNYSRTLDVRLAACDTVIFLDLPRLVCLWRMLRRRVRFHGRTRPDMVEGCPERFSWAFIVWIWRYPIARRPRVLQQLSALRPEQRAIVLRSDRETEDFMLSIAPSRS